MNKFYKLGYYLIEKSLQNDMKRFSFTVDDQEKYQKELELVTKINTWVFVLVFLPMFLWLLFTLYVAVFV